MDIDGQPPSSPINIQPLSVSSLSEIGEKCLYMVVNLHAEDYMYGVYRIEMSGITNSFSGSSNNSQAPPISCSSPLLLLGKEFPLGMVFFSFGSRIYMLGSSEGDGIIEYGSRSVHVFDTVTCTFGSAAYEQQLLTEKYQPVVIQPLKPFDDRVYVFSGDRCAEDLEVFYPDHDQCENNSNSNSKSKSSSCWKFIGGPCSSFTTFPPDCRIDHHSTVSDGFVLLTRNNVVLLYNIPWATWTVVEDHSHMTCLYLDHDHRAFAYEIAKWFYMRVSQPVGDSLLCSYFVDRKDGRHQFGKSPHLYLPDARPCRIKERDYLLYLGNLCFCVVRSGYDRHAGRRCSPDEPVANHHATVTLLRIHPSANSISEERSSSYKIMPLAQSEDTDVAYVSACFVI